MIDVKDEVSIVLSLFGGTVKIKEVPFFMHGDPHFWERFVVVKCLYLHLMTGGTISRGWYKLESLCVA